jgi:two-component system, NarL family, nitrate/nitrite response regulator NarL
MMSVADGKDPGEASPDVWLFMVSPVRIHREGLAHLLQAEPGIHVAGAAGGVEEALALLPKSRANMVLLDISMDGERETRRRLGEFGDLRVLVLGIVECAHEVVAYAEAGICGYVTQDDSLADLVDTIRRAARDEFSCSPSIGAILLHRVAALAQHGAVAPEMRYLTIRELQVVELINEGLSNKEIARRLNIQLATAKNHVHNILEKLSVGCRGEAAAKIRRLGAPGGPGTITTV